jgi:CO dehydrogenase maturation factor
VAVVVNKFIDSSKSWELLKGINNSILGIVPYNQCFVRADIENVPPYEVCEDVMEVFVGIKEKLLKL